MKNLVNIQIRQIYILIEIISVLLICLFVYTGISKLNEHNNFQGVLSQSPLIGAMSNFLSWLIPILELFTALLLFFPFARKWGLFISLILMTIFTLYVFYMIVFIPHLPCSCGGVIKLLTWKEHLLFNIFFSVIALLGISLYKKTQQRTQNALFT